jgi:serine/threonine protein kinase
VKLYAAQLVSAIDYLQEKHVMHRDLKPQNLMLDENFNIKIVSWDDSNIYTFMILISVSSVSLTVV